MSSLQVDNIQTYNSNPPVIKNVSGTEVGTFCRAWVNFNGTGTVAIRSSFNVSSITDNGTGDYTVNFTTAMVDGNYSAIATSEWTSGVTNVTVVTTSTLNSTSGARIKILNFSSVSNDSPVVCISIFR
jgi:hypothetical protein